MCLVIDNAPGLWAVGKKKIFTKILARILGIGGLGTSHLWFRRL
jgi:hypothetical protein